MRQMGIEAIYAKPKTSEPNPEHRIYPYLLRELDITEVNQVWCSDITYIRVRGGFMYLVAVMDWFSRYVLSWELSNTMEDTFCVSALEEALERGKPLIFNTDQGSQFTGSGFTGVLKEAGMDISMDGRGRWMDNVFIERLWRSAKYEEVYLKDYQNGVETYRGLEGWFGFYNNEQPHQGLSYRTPAQVYWEGRSQRQE
jgi:putative transposase